MGNAANTSLPSRKYFTATSCSGFDMNSNQPKLSLVHLLRQPFWLFSHYNNNNYFTNPSYCPNNQSEFCGRQRPQKWTNRGLYSRRSFPPSPPPWPSVFLLESCPLPFIRLLRRLLDEEQIWHSLSNTPLGLSLFEAVNSNISTQSVSRGFPSRCLQVHAPSLSTSSLN